MDSMNLEDSKKGVCVLYQGYSLTCVIFNPRGSTKRIWKKKKENGKKQQMIQTPMTISNEENSKSSS